MTTPRIGNRDVRRIVCRQAWHSHLLISTRVFASLLQTRLSRSWFYFIVCNIRLYAVDRKDLHDTLDKQPWEWSAISKVSLDFYCSALPADKSYESFEMFCYSYLSDIITAALLLVILFLTLHNILNARGIVFTIFIIRNKMRTYKNSL